MEQYYSTDITIPVVEIYASSKEEADAIIQEFIDRIAPIMDSQIRWDDADWTIQLNTLKDGVWEQN
jgi:hypothetical protein